MCTRLLLQTARVFKVQEALTAAFGVPLFGHFWVFEAQNDDSIAIAEIQVGAGFGDLTEDISAIPCPILACFCLPTCILALFTPKSPEAFLTGARSRYIPLFMAVVGICIHWMQKGVKKGR